MLVSAMCEHNVLWPGLSDILGHSAGWTNASHVFLQQAGQHDFLY